MDVKSIGPSWTESGNSTQSGLAKIVGWDGSRYRHGHEHDHGPAGPINKAQTNGHRCE